MKRTIIKSNAKPTRSSIKPIKNEPCTSSIRTAKAGSFRTLRQKARLANAESLSLSRRVGTASDNRIADHRNTSVAGQLSNFAQITTLHDIEIFVSRKYIDDATKTAVGKIARLAIAHQSQPKRKSKNSTKNAEAIEKDQERLRENIEKLKDTPEAKQLIARYIAKADTQETRLEQIVKEKKAAEEEQAQLESELVKSSDANLNLIENCRKIGTRRLGAPASCWLRERVPRRSREQLREVSR